MEILAHTLWTAAGARKINKITEKKAKIHQISLAWSAFWGVFPDLFAFTPAFIISLYSFLVGAQEFGSFSTRHQVMDGFNLSHSLYNYSHSLVFFVLVFLILFLILKRPPLAMLGWALHILLDIPSHSLAFFPTPFLFPISNYHFPYGIRWSNTWFMIINYSLLLIVWGGVLFKKYRRKLSSI